MWGIIWYKVASKALHSLSRRILKEEIQYENSTWCSGRILMTIAFQHWLVRVVRTQLDLQEKPELEQG